jgi:hypothetical protein
MIAPRLWDHGFVLSQYTFCNVAEVSQLICAAFECLLLGKEWLVLVGSMLSIALLGVLSCQFQRFWYNGGLFMQRRRLSDSIFVCTAMMLSILQVISVVLLTICAVKDVAL